MLVACSTITPTPQSAQPLKEPPTTWACQGKIAIRSLQNVANEQNHSPKNQVLRFSWHKKTLTSKLILNGPLGFGRVQLEISEKGATLYRGDEVIASARDAQTLLYEHTGIDLPTSMLEYWVTGLPYPHIAHAPAATNNANNPDHSAYPGFGQQGWQLHYPKTMIVENTRLPRRIDASSAQAQLRIAIANWQLN